MPKSQCWCVDGESTFVLRIRSYNYYRIELPNEDEEARAKVEELKTVLSNILAYEVTPCPFKREFTVDVPDGNITPKKKKPWKAKPHQKHNFKEENTTPFGALSSEERVIEEIAVDPGHLSDGDLTSFSGRNSRESLDMGTDDRCEEVTKAEPATSVLNVKISSEYELSTPLRYSAVRTTTAPASLDPQSRTLLSPVGLVDPNTSVTSATKNNKNFLDSFQTSSMPLPPSPPYSGPPSPSTLSVDTENLKMIRQRNHNHEISDSTIHSLYSPGPPSDTESEVPSFHTTNEKDNVPPSRGFGPAPKTPTLIEDGSDSGSDIWSEIATPSPHKAQDLRHRHGEPTDSDQRTYSPPPPSTVLFSPPQTSGAQVTTAIVQRTCAILAPPVHLIAFMLIIASKIASGNLRALTGGYDECWERMRQGWVGEADSTQRPVNQDSLDCDHDHRVVRTPGALADIEQECGQSCEID